jgi:hypothetical protein
MKNLYLIAVALFTAVLFQPLSSFAQGGCIEIKSILVDACGSPEGENEMVRFDVGSTALNVSNMNVDWPNNPWLGLFQTSIRLFRVAAPFRNLLTEYCRQTQRYSSLQVPTSTLSSIHLPTSMTI